LTGGAKESIESASLVFIEADDGRWGRIDSGELKAADHGMLISGFFALLVPEGCSLTGLTQCLPCPLCSSDLASWKPNHSCFQWWQIFRF